MNTATLPQPLKPSLRHIHWLASIPFFAMHVGVLVGLFFFPITAAGVGLAIALYLVRMFAITGGYHRYFSHKTYKTSRWFQFVMAWIGTASLQKGVLWWAANHRHHHKYSGQPEDIHAPEENGIWWSHIGWIIDRRTEATQWDLIRDFAKYPELRWLNKYHLVPGIAMAAVLLLTGGLWAFYWGFVVSTVINYHATFSINSLSHMWGYRRFKTADDSRNNPLLALITLGEGWHNNHHYYQNSVRQGFYWWEYDVTYYILRSLAAIGLVWDLKGIPERVLRPTDQSPPEQSNNSSYNDKAPPLAA